MSKTYVKDSTSVLKKVLLCPPTYFEFEPINVITEDCACVNMRNSRRRTVKTG